MASISFTQTDFRLRNDDGSESAATWMAAVNTNIPVDLALGNVNLRIRIAVQEIDVTSATFAANLFCSLNGGTYFQVTASTLGVKVVDSTNLTDNDNTTQQITAFTFVAGRVDDVDGTTTATGSIAQNSGTEFEFMVQLSAGYLSTNDTLDFRVYRSGIPVDTYTNTPRITIARHSQIHARATDTLLHAEETQGERNFVYFIAELVDESGASLVDQTGASLVAFGETPVIAIHAGVTDTLLHSEDL